jgi:hypothetical protein
VPPPTITPPRAPGAFPNVGASPSIPVEKEVAFFAAMLGLEGIPPVLSAYPDSSLSRYLKLSSDQLERIETLRNGLYRETRDLRYDLLKKRLDMSRLFADPSTSGAALISAHKEALSLQIKLADAAARAAIEARRFLKPDQIEALDRLPASMAAPTFRLP